MKVISFSLKRDETFASLKGKWVLITPEGRNYNIWTKVVKNDKEYRLHYVVDAYPRWVNEAKLYSENGYVFAIEAIATVTPIFKEGVLQFNCAFGKEGEVLNEKVTDEVLYPFGVTRADMTDNSIVDFTIDSAIRITNEAQLAILNEI